ncbi:MAG: peptidoglycan DD-metalloendopeptidase family protein [Muribaculaceae bacterium]|nr:peptidoglycan DD-metalloendopeptidase family protein [Muribaculaceae bacterium]
MRFSFEKILHVMISVRHRMGMLIAVSLMAMAMPVADFGISAEAQTKTTGLKKKKTASSKTQKPKTQKSTSGTPKKTSQGQKKTPQGQKKTSQGQKKSSKSTSVPKSSSEARQLEEAAQREIRHTKEQLRLNEQEIKTGLSDLNRLSSEIATGRTQVAGLQKKVTSLNEEIVHIGDEITQNESELTLMRDEYLKAVKKMRLTKKNQSSLAFIFASENFNQAMRRIRYMRQFSEWKAHKSADIDKKIEQLGKERTKLAKAKESHTIVLGQLTKSQEKLEENHRKQEELIATLRKNGDALQAHLIAKQNEANRLRETISSLIAQKQARAEAERRAREKAEAERKAKAEAERIAREKAEAERRAAEKAAAEKALAEEKAAAERAAAEKEAAERAAKKALEEKLAAEKALAEKTEAEKAAAQKEAEEKAKAYKKAAEEKAKADRKFAEAKAKAEEKARKEKEKQDKKKKKNSESGSRTRRGRGLTNKVEVREKTDEREAVRAADPVAVTTPKSVEKTATTSTSKAVNFASLRGKLPRPVDGSWRITNQFGRHAMPEMPEIQYDNPGIDAEVAKGTTVKSVCSGKVSGVYKLAGYGNVVIVNHGDYYTVYGNLASTNVTVGTQVGSGSALGTAGADPDDQRHGSVHFEVWKGREKQNPSSWLR